MRYRKEDANGDMQFGNGLADFYIDTAEGVAQAVLTRLRLWAGEWFLDTSEGTPYQQAILGANKSLTIEPAIRERILETEGVESLESFSMAIDSESRKVTIEASINTDYGAAQLTGIL